MTFAIPAIFIASAGGILPGWIAKFCTALLAGGAIILVILIAIFLLAQPAQEHHELSNDVSVEEA